MDLLMELLDATASTEAAAQAATTATAPKAPIDASSATIAMNDRASEASADKRIKEGGS